MKVISFSGVIITRHPCTKKGIHIALVQTHGLTFDMRKHGGKVTLPLCLHKNIKEKGLKAYLSADD
jgi:hypothetical protein